ncbi:MAG: tungsten formylmethanofuran dehydrogenase, partial [Verrucomicrobia bacterium]|nr:tungsten formylmethanofuran dehydrogenase [Cytophagales bacterium]
GLSAAGCKPIVEIQSAEALWSGLNQLANILAKSYYLTDRRSGVQALIRVLVGNYPGSSPYQSQHIASVLLTIKGIKVVFPSDIADLKGLMRAAFADPNPVVILEHKSFYSSKMTHFFDASDDYIVPLGKCRMVQQASQEQSDEGYTCTVITYGMGVHLAKQASEKHPGSVEILDLRTLHPLDFEEVVASVKRHGKALVLTEEPLQNSFAEALAGRISKACFKFLDAPVHTCGAAEVPTVPMNEKLAHAVLPTPEKIAKIIGELLNY